ncbi:hypothetical protein VaNZ11_013129, partial [Volvox africanus]
PLSASQSSTSRGRVAATVAAAATTATGSGGCGSGGGNKLPLDLPGPDDICDRTQDWGVEDRWIEPWDMELAKRTCRLLLSHWGKHSYDTDLRLMRPSTLDVTSAGGSTEEDLYDDGGEGAGTGAAAGALDTDSGSRTPRVDRNRGFAGLNTPISGGGGGGSSGDGSGRWRRRRPHRHRPSPSTETETEASDEATTGIAAAVAKLVSTTSTPVAATAATAAADSFRHRMNTVCSHPCCAARPFCIIAELKRTRDLYMGREDQFRIKAVDRAMGLLVRMSWPLEAPSQLKQLQLGRGSEEKVAEILATGRLSRNDAYEQDEQRATMRKFLQVWGCGESTARRWWASGSRSLDDVRQRTDLTAQQRLGLRHFEDFQHRIPRAEVNQVATVVRHVTIESLQALTQLPYSVLIDRLHVRPLGSYVRGSATSADVDFIIAPSPQADPRVSPYALLVALVGRLEAGGYLDVDSVRRIETRQDHFRTRQRPPPFRLNQDHHQQLHDEEQQQQQKTELRQIHGSVEQSGLFDDDAALEASSASAGGSKRDQDSSGTRGRYRRGPHGEQTPPDNSGTMSDVDCATWLGVWRLPGSGHYCRVDIKCYRRRLLPYAVMYFSSGKDFNRALRYWASSPPPHVRQLARAIHPRADAFRLSDKELAVVERRPPGASASREGVVDYVIASVPCSCETDIFRALGLNYVPPSLRDITRVE